MELSKINEWLEINKLSINVDKTKYMIFHNSQRKLDMYDQLKLSINNLPIKRTKTFNFLGIVINELLTWNDHITYISQKINPVVGLLNRLKHQLPTAILKMIYNSLILFGIFLVLPVSTILNTFPVCSLIYLSSCFPIMFLYLSSRNLPKSTLNSP